MPFKNFFTLRRSLIILQILAFFPFFILFSLHSIKEAKIILDNQKIIYLNEVKLAGHSENKIDAIYGILKTLSLDDSLKKMDKNEISNNFKSLLKKTDLFHNILLADTDGNILISAIPIGKIPPASDRLYFKRAKEKKRFCMGRVCHIEIYGKTCNSLCYASS